MRTSKLRTCKRGRSERGFALPAVLFLMISLMSLTAILSVTSRQNLTRMKYEKEANSTYFVAEGAVSRITADMSVFGSLWDTLTPLATKPNGYTEYSPATYAATNGIPSCSGLACQRNMYPTGGGLIKNVGPLEGDGSTVNNTYSVSDQLDFSNPQDADVTLANLSGWSQVERLDETTPGAETVGGGLSNSITDGGNAKAVRFRLTGTTMKRIRGRLGTSSVVLIVELPLS